MGTKRHIYLHNHCSARGNFISALTLRLSVSDTLPRPVGRPVSLTWALEAHYWSAQWPVIAHKTYQPFYCKGSYAAINFVLSYLSFICPLRGIRNTCCCHKIPWLPESFTACMHVCACMCVGGWEISYIHLSEDLERGHFLDSKNILHSALWGNYLKVHVGVFHIKICFAWENGIYV